MPDQPSQHPSVRERAERPVPTWKAALVAVAFAGVSAGGTTFVPGWRIEPEETSELRVRARTAEREAEILREALTTADRRLDEARDSIDELAALARRCTP